MSVQEPMNKVNIEQTIGLCRLHAVQFNVETV